jgi:hypothetical protein
VVDTYVTGASTIKVNIDGSVVTLPCVLGTAYSAGHTVLVARDGKSGGWVLGRIGTAVNYDPPDDTFPAATPQSRTILPVDMASFGTGTGQFIPGVALQMKAPWHMSGPTLGAAYYGSQFTALNADLSFPYSASLTVLPQRVNTTAGYALTPHLWLGAESDLVGMTAPTLNETFVGPTLTSQQITTIPLPTLWVTDLLSGSRGSVATFEPTLNCDIHFSSATEYAASFAITIDYYA